MYWMKKKSTHYFKTTSKFSWLVSDGSKAVVPHGSSGRLAYWHVAWLELMNSTLDRLCHRHLGLMKKYFLNGCMCLQRLVLGQWLSHLLNMRHKLYQPDKPTSNTISVVSSKIPKDQDVNLKPKLGLFDLYMWKRKTITLAEQDGGSYIRHRSKQIHGNNIQEKRLR